MNFFFFCIVMSTATWLSKVVARITLYPAILCESYDKKGFLKGNYFIGFLLAYYNLSFQERL